MLNLQFLIEFGYDNKPFTHQLTVKVPVKRLALYVRGKAESRRGPCTLKSYLMRLRCNVVFCNNCNFAIFLPCKQVNLKKPI